jgi:uncharacterized caspase-like protein
LVRAIFVGFRAVACAWLALIMLLVTGVRAESRLALVVGNVSYEHVTPLANAVHDADLIAERLKGRGFDVTLLTDLDLKHLKRALLDFFGKVERAGKEAAVLIYYAGHGVQVSGSNYLIPIDAQIENEGDVDIEAIKVDNIMSMIASTGSPLNIIILDACRNNPFRGFRSTNRGLVQIDAPSGTLVAYSTAPGKVARDGPKGGNSPYSSALAKTLGEPGLTIEEVFKRVRGIVNSETSGEQVPWESSSLVGYFYPAGKDLGTTIALPVPPRPWIAVAESIQGVWGTSDNACSDFRDEVRPE